MLEINKYKLCPSTSSRWGEITGDITNQEDLVEYIESHGGGGGEAVWGQITGNIGDQADLAALLEEYALKEWVENKGYLVQSDLSQYATRQWVTGRGYITSDALDGYATQEWVGDQGFITSDALTGYATEQWVGEQGYIDQIKTVNNQSLIGTGNIQISGLTPAQEEAISPLTNPSDGMLTTKTFKGKTMDINIPLYGMGNDYSQHIYKIDGHIYYYYYGTYAEWNPVSYQFDNLPYISGGEGRPLWKDKSGRYYEGCTYQVNMTTHQTTSISMNENYYTYEYGHHNIWEGENGIYLLGTVPMKFNETTQEFENYNYTAEQGFDISNIGPYLAKWGIWYDGHFVGIHSSQMWELIEHENSLEFSLVNDPYFPMDFTQTEYFIVASGELYYMYGWDQYKLIDGVWEPWQIISGTYGDNAYTRTSPGGQYDEEGKVYLGLDAGLAAGFMSLTNLFDEDFEATYWGDVRQVAVDLVSGQEIQGNKTFNMLSTYYFYVDTVNPKNSSTQISLGENTTTADNIKFTVPGLFTVNNKNIATTDYCIVNRQEIKYGKRTVEVVVNGRDPYRWNYWTTHTGRLFYSGYYEFNGTSWSSVSMGIFPNGNYVHKTANNTFYVDGNETYLWDDVNSDWTLLNQNAPGYDPHMVWVCGDTLRYEDSYKLIYDSGTDTWSWEQDSISTYKYGLSTICNNTVYILCISDDTVYTYDETTHTFTSLGMWHYQYDKMFTVGDEIFYFYNSKIYKIDLSKVGVEQYIDTETTIPYTTHDYFYGEYDGYCWLYLEYSKFGYCYDILEEVPEVPSTNGTYVLQATRSGDDVTYEWVSNMP